MLWGSTIDPLKAKTYVLPIVDKLLPPMPHIDHDASATTNSHPKPTAHLPGDHGTAEGENSKPAFPAGNGTTNGGKPGTMTNTTSGVKTNGTSEAITNGTTPGSPMASPSPELTPTADEGWFSDMGSLVSSQKWFFGAIALVFVFGVGAAIFFWRRRLAARRRANYFSVASEDLPMSNVDRRNRGEGGGPRTKDLYDAFGEVSDDEDADEETSLRPGRPNERSTGGGLGFHEGFLDDDPATGGSSVPKYRDEPEGSRHLGGHDSPDAPPASDGSWEHASDAR